MKKLFLVLALFLFCGVCAVPTRAQNPNYAGFFDVGDCNVIAGWAADTNRLNTSINVSIYDGSTLLTTVLANGARPDVGSAIGDNGVHGFSIPFPSALKNGQSHAIGVRFESTSTELSNSPRTIGPCGPTGFTIPNPKITTFEISKTSSRASTQLNGFESLGIDATTNANLNLRVEIDHPDRVHFYRLGEIACPESVSDHPEDRMKNLPWQAYTQGQSFSFRLSTSIAQPYGTRCVFMEVNRTENESSASPAKGDSIVLAPAHSKTFTLTGVALKNFIDRAKALGYKFTITSHSFTGDVPCPGGLFPQGGSKVDLSKADFVEQTAAKIFDRNERFLNPFWKMTGINITGGSVSIDAPPSGRLDDPFRTVGIKQGLTGSGGGRGFIADHDPAGSITCVAAANSNSFDTVAITSITLEGPDDKQPEDSLFNPNQLRILVRPNFKIGP